MAGIIGMGANNRRAAIDAFGTSAGMQKRRERTNEQIEAREDQRRTSSIAQGAGLGASIAQGTAVGGPWGAAIGAGIGLISNSLF